MYNFEDMRHNSAISWKIYIIRKILRVVYKKRSYKIESIDHFPMVSTNLGKTIASISFSHILPKNVGSFQEF